MLKIKLWVFFFFSQWGVKPAVILKENIEKVMFAIFDLSLNMCYVYQAHHHKLSCQDLIITAHTCI